MKICLNLFILNNLHDIIQLADYVLPLVYCYTRDGIKEHHVIALNFSIYLLFYGLHLVLIKLMVNYFISFEEVFKETLLTAVP